MGTSHSVVGGLMPSPFIIVNSFSGSDARITVETWLFKLGGKMPRLEPVDVEPAAVKPVDGWMGNPR